MIYIVGATATRTTSRRRGRPVIDGGSRGAVGVDVRKQAVTHESVKLTHGSVESALRMRTVKHEWGVSVIGLQINVHTVYIPCVVLVTVTTSTATVANRIRYAERLLERLLPLGRHARNGHVRPQLT